VRPAFRERNDGAHGLAALLGQQTVAAGGKILFAKSVRSAHRGSEVGDPVTGGQHGRSGDGCPGLLRAVRVGVADPERLAPVAHQRPQQAVDVLLRRRGVDQDLRFGPQRVHVHAGPRGDAGQVPVRRLLRVGHRLHADEPDSLVPQQPLPLGEAVQVPHGEQRGPVGQLRHLGRRRPLQLDHEVLAAVAGGVGLDPCPLQFVLAVQVADALAQALLDDDVEPAVDVTAYVLGNQGGAQVVPARVLLAVALLGEEDRCHARSPPQSV
jgi:hypothetical protein